MSASILVGAAVFFCKPGRSVEGSNPGESARPKRASILVGSCSGDKCGNLCDTLGRRCPISEGLAAFRTHQQHRATKCNVHFGVALLANYLTVRIEFHEVVLRGHAVPSR